MFRLQFSLRVVCIALASFLPIFSSAVRGQTKGDVYVGYSFVSSDPTFGSGGGDLSSASAGRASLNGWEASASVRLLPWIRAVADVGAGYGTVPVVFSSILGSQKQNVNSNLHTYLLGPRAAIPVGRVTPFGQALFGYAHQSIAANAFVENVGEHEGAFAFDLGGGLDFRLISRIAWRIQADYLQTKLFSSTQHDPRIGTGIVFRF
jgi:Outer membrane protein beta-barrel domain